MNPAHEKTHLNVSHAERKMRALSGAGVIARNDPSLDHVGGDQPWIKHRCFNTSLTVDDSAPRLPTGRMTWGREQTSTQWEAMKIAPDNSRYALRSQGLIGDAIAALFSLGPQQQ